MESLWHILMALAAVVAPLLLAWWLLARSTVRQPSGERGRPRRDRKTAPSRDTMEP